MKVISALVLLLFVSCSNSNKLVLFDEYYSALYPVEAVKSIDYKIINLNDFSLDIIEGYNHIVLSPMLYKKHSHLLSDYNSLLYVVDWDKPLLNDSHKIITVDNTSAYNELIKSLSKNESYNNIKFGIIADSLNIHDEKEFSTLLDFFRSDYKYTSLAVTGITTRSEIKDFINNNEDVGFWIVNSSTFGLYIYELLPAEKEIVINDGSILYRENSNIIYSIEKNFNDNLYEVFEKKSFVISSELKKY